MRKRSQLLKRYPVPDFLHTVLSDSPSRRRTRPRGLIIYAHTTTAEFLEDAVVRDGLTDERVGAWHVEHMLSGGQQASQRTQISTQISSRQMR
jgi:hypothetical protein